MARGIYKRVKKVVVLAEVVKDFQELARQTTPGFRYCDAARAKIWSVHASRKLGLTFNAVKLLAGLPAKLKRDSDGKSIIGPERNQYESGKPPKRLRGTPVKPCLGILPNDTNCGKKVPKGEYFCEVCRDRKNSI